MVFFQDNSDRYQRLSLIQELEMLIKVGQERENAYKQVAIGLSFTSGW